MPPLNNPCLVAPHAQQPWCDHTLAVGARVADMLSRMTLDEKIASLDTDSPAIPSLGLNAYNWWSEATHGVSHVNASGQTPATTNFAFPITTAAAFNRSLWRSTGMAVAREARAFMNAGHGYSTYWAPVVNLAREPRWGRNLESSGEDPLLTGEHAAAWVSGFEHLPEEPRYLSASACCKHYAANSMEDSHVAGVHHTRYSANPNISSQDLVDSYLLPFQLCVEKGKVSSLMCAYNSFNGVPTCASKWLLDTVARQAWQFDGYVTSDCAAVGNIVAPHRYVNTSEQAVAVTLSAGMDISCAHFIGPHGKAALAQGLIDEALLDRALARLFRVRMRLQHFDPPGPLQRIAPSALCTEETAALARDGVAQGAALYKNAHGTLPLSAAALRSVAVLGPNANLSKAMAGYYGSAAACGASYPTMVDAVATLAPSALLRQAAGVPSVTSDDVSGVRAAASLAAASDVTVLVLGTDLSVAKENQDAVNLTFSQGQLALATAVAAASPSPIVVVTLSAVPLDLTPLLTDPKVGALVHAGQPSIQTLGVADVLFGRTSPAARAVQTVYPPAYQHQISPFDFHMRPGPSAWPRPDSPGPCADVNPAPAGRPQPPPIVPSPNCTLGTNPGRTYRFYNGTAVIPFGFGLSYTSWRYTVAQAPARPLSLAPLRRLLRASRAETGTEFPPLAAVPAAAEYVLNVTNTGARDADDVVLAFLSPPGAGEGGRPLRSLFGFERVHVKAGQTVSVWLYPPLTALATVEPDGVRRALAGEHTVSFGVAETHTHGMGYAQVRLVAE